MACGDRAGQARRSRAARAAGGRVPIRNSNTGGGSRTHTGVSAQRILSPQRLPFRHAGSCGEVSTGRGCHKRKEPSRPGRFAIGAGPIRSRLDQSGGTPIHDPARTSSPLPRHSSPATNLLGKSKACNRSTWAVRARRSPTGPWSQWCSGAHRASSRLARSIWTFSLVMEAEGVGFEPTDRRNLSTVFKTVPINHSGTPPKAQTKDR